MEYRPPVDPQDRLPLPKEDPGAALRIGSREACGPQVRRQLSGVEIAGKQFLEEEGVQPDQGAGRLRIAACRLQNMPTRPSTQNSGGLLDGEGREVDGFLHRAALQAPDPEIMEMLGEHRHGALVPRLDRMGSVLRQCAPRFTP